MRILTTLYYYRPHFSGLTVYTERLARALAGRGHQITVLTSRYDRSLPAFEQLDGIQVRRLPVAFRLSKGVVMPSAPWWGARLARQHDVVHVHVPQLDAAVLAVLARGMGKPVVMTYHCDLRLPSTPVHWMANLASRLADRVTAAAANVVVANTLDYADHAPLLRRRRSKMMVIPPPVEMPRVDLRRVAALRRRFDVRPGERVVGMAARLAAEKGAEVLARAMPLVLRQIPEARVLYVGQHLEVLGEEAYARRLVPLLQDLGSRWTFLGMLTAEEMAAFFRLCEVTVLPSLNSTESFGMVQVESMVCGTPVVASDLPGVREPTQVTGMGLRVPPGDPAALADAIVRVLSRPTDFRSDTAQIAEWFSPERAALQYEEVFAALLGDG
jgi:glycosyltransferase involved in cell wall biosynthesis